MGQSLAKRLNGQSEEFVTYARDFGIGPAMEHFEVKDYLSALHFLETAAPGEGFVYYKTEANELGRPDAFERLLDAMLRKYDALKTQTGKLAEENRQLKAQVDYYKAQQWNRTQPVLQAVLAATK